MCIAAFRSLPDSGLVLRSAAHVCRPLPEAHASSQAMEGLQHVNMKAVEGRVEAGRDAHEWLAAHPLVSQSPRKPDANAAGAAPEESVQSARGRNGGASAAFSFSGAAQGFAPKHAARGGLASASSTTAGAKRQHSDASPTDGGKRNHKRKKKKSKSVSDGRISFK